MKKIKTYNADKIIPGEKIRLIAVLLLIIALLESSCGVVSGIFKAGMDFGIFIVISLIVIIAFIVIRIRKKSNK